MSKQVFLRKVNKMQTVIRIEGLKEIEKNLDPRIYKTALAATVNDFLLLG